MCLCVCYSEGTLKQFDAPSARTLKTNQHVESFQTQFQHKEAVLLLHFHYAQQHNSSNQDEIKALISDSHHVDT